MNSVQAERSKKHRLHALCPYFAMFPHDFARERILATTQPGDLVLDPFSGRGTVVLEALLNEREGIACDINPVAAVISMAKAQAPSLTAVNRRIDEIEAEFRETLRTGSMVPTKGLPDFFHRAFAPSVLEQIMFLRGRLDWRNDKTDRFIAALILGHLHGESNRSPNYLSNQMPHTIAIKPEYAIRYWTAHGMVPPDRDAFSLLRSRAAFRYADGVPERKGTVVCADARHALRHFWPHKGKVAAVVTSPPYLNVTNFEEDQWLRLWFLGGEPAPTYGKVSCDDRHQNQVRYFAFLRDVWVAISPLLRAGARLVCRIGTKAIPAEELCRSFIATIRSVWPRSALRADPQPSALRNRQTDVFRPGAAGCGYEYDFDFAIT